MDYIYYKNQIKAANKILNIYELMDTKYALLIAQMQSGKTGVCRYTIEQLLLKNKIKKDLVFYICGLNDNDLRRQIIKDFNGIINYKNILFSKQLQKINYGMKTIEIPEFIIIDESHYAGLIDSQIDQFIKNLNHSIKKIYILSVSATPMGEIAIDLNISKVILKPAKEYYGIKDIFELGRIFQSVNFNGDNDDFINIIDKEYNIQKKNNKWKYCIIRLCNQYYFKDLEELIYSYGYNILFINNHNEYSDISINFNKLIDTEPLQMTIIWIYNSLRAGKQLNTKNVGFIHDSYSTNTDTTAQALLGRVCGYNKKDHNVNCYIDLKSAERMLIWIRSNYDIGYVPLKSKNILNGNSCNELDWKLNPPIYIRLDDEYVKLFYGLKLKYGNKYPYKNKLLTAILNSIISLDDDLLYDKVNNIFSNYKFGRFGGLMVLDKNNAKRSYKEHWCANYKAYLNKKSIRGFEVGLDQLNDYENKFFYIFCNMNNAIYSTEFGGCLIIYKKYIPDAPKVGYKLDIKLSEKSRFNSLSTII